MEQKVIRMLFPVLISITLFSLWAGFALLVVNKLIYKDLPGYEIGKICIWEFVALLVAAILSKLLIDKWGNLKLDNLDGKQQLIMNPKFGIYFGIYFLIAIAVGIWQFWIFSKGF